MNREKVVLARRVAMRKVRLDKMLAYGAPPSIAEHVRHLYEEALAKAKEAGVDDVLLWVCELLERHEDARMELLERTALGWLADALLALATTQPPFTLQTASPPEDSPIGKDEWKEFLDILNSIQDKKAVQAALHYLSLFLASAMIELTQLDFTEVIHSLTR